MMKGTSTADGLLKTATEALTQKQYPKAETLLRQGIEVLTASGDGRDDVRIASAMEKLAGVHVVQQKYELAANEYGQVLRTVETLRPNDTFSQLRVLYYLGKSYFDGQKYDLAEAAFRRGLSLAETVPDSHNSAAFCHYQLGFLLYFVGRYKEAEPYLLAALQLCESARGVSQSETIELYRRLALTYSSCPEIGKDPEPYYRKAVAAINPDGDTRQTYIEDLCRLAEHIAECGRFEEADVLFTELLTLLDGAETSNQSEHWVKTSCIGYFTARGTPEVISNLVAEEKSRPHAYGEIVQQRLRHAEETLSEDDPALAEALLNSGNHAIYEQKFEDAETLFRRALHTHTIVYGAASEPVVTTLNRICSANRLLDNFDAAEAAVQRALEIAKVSFSDSHVYPWTLESLALLREAQAKVEEAADLYENSVKEYERTCSLASYATAEALYHQGKFLLRNNKLEQAVASIRRAISVMDDVEALSPYEKSDYLNVLASALEGQGRIEEAEQVRFSAQKLWDAGTENARNEK